MRGRPGHRPAPCGDSPGPRGQPRAAVFQRPPHGCVFSPLLCLTLRGSRGPGGGRGGGFGTYFSFSLTTGGLKFSGAEGAAGGWRACLYRGRCPRAPVDAPRLLIAASAPCPSMVRSAAAVSLAATCSQPWGPGKMARGRPCVLRETVALIWTQSVMVTPIPQPLKSNKTHTWGAPSTCWTLTAADGPSSPRKGQGAQGGGTCVPGQEPSQAAFEPRTS